MYNNMLSHRAFCAQTHAPRFTYIFRVASLPPQAPTAKGYSFAAAVTANCDAPWPSRVTASKGGSKGAGDPCTDYYGTSDECGADTRA